MGVYSRAGSKYNIVVKSMRARRGHGYAPDHSKAQSGPDGRRGGEGPAAARKERDRRQTQELPERKLVIRDTVTNLNVEERNEI